MDGLRAARTPPDHMTATDIRDALTPSLARQIAREAGWKLPTWDTACHRGRALTPDETAAYKAALSSHIKNVQGLRRRL